MAKLLVKIQNSVFPVRVNGDRYQNGDELEIDEVQFTKGTMAILDKIEDKIPNPDGDNNPNGNPDGNGGKDEFEGKTVEELKAYADEHNIDIGNATSEKGIIKKIKEATEKAE
ncbi:hypothetical protein [Paucisalibacillus globulus]|uniref:hypothetical protein n=1 Tax=Paucisalibacillus globulus TaxID=351095 RepID=UPI000BB8A6E1|nr:hypothetical protein [Paucisalibacillus globulus]